MAHTPAPLKLVAVTAGLGRPSSTRLLTDRLTEATRRHLGATTDPGTPLAATPLAEVGAVGPRAVELRVVELRDLAVDIAHHLVTGFPPPALREALDAVTEADGVIAVSPVFTASYSGLFKSFVDLIDPDALTGTPVLIAATGGTARHSLVLEHAMRPLFSYLRAVVVPTAVFAATEDWGGTEGPAARVDRAAGELAALMTGRAALRLPGQQPEVVPFAEQLAALRTG
ncbi:FMN reductase [Streptomyces sp. NPDC051567]|uniref:FMN reductase n=1 Tax=Streptomyces sp. NPDC051567 TaxID=3365660 RepID=UPI00378F5062